MNNLTMLTDLYQLTMMQGHFMMGNYNKKAAFSYFYRTNPFNGNYAITAGLKQVIDYVQSIKFTGEDIDFLKSTRLFNDKFLEYLRAFKFTGTITGLHEGTVVFPNEPIINVIAPINEAQFIETTLLCLMNHQSLIATKASRIKFAADNNPVIDMGIRRALGADSALYGSRAAIIGGCSATSNVMAAQQFNLPPEMLKGTMAHAWVMSYENEYEAFLDYELSRSKGDLTLLLDTYDTIESGLENAIKLFTKLQNTNILPDNIGVRLDSGDLKKLTWEVRAKLNKAGFPQCKIVVSNDLDEYSVDKLALNDNVDAFGVGSNLLTAKGSLFNGVYKLVALKDEKGKFQPKIKLSSTPEKTTNPGILNIKRCYYQSSGNIARDVLFDVANDPIRYRRYDPLPTIIEGVKLHQDIFLNGKYVYTDYIENYPSILNIQSGCTLEKSALPYEVLNIHDNKTIPVKLSDYVEETKNNLIKKYKGGQ
jgi:nicotinate phosphoribosyltransferase